jgi:hypothetical protein
MIIKYNKRCLLELIILIYNFGIFSFNKSEEKDVVYSILQDVNSGENFILQPNDNNLDYTKQHNSLSTSNDQTEYKKQNLDTIFEQINNPSDNYLPNINYNNNIDNIPFHTLANPLKNNKNNQKTLNVNSQQLHIQEYLKKFQKYLSEFSESLDGHENRNENQNSNSFNKTTTQRPNITATNFNYVINKTTSAKLTTSTITTTTTLTSTGTFVRNQTIPNDNQTNTTTTTTKGSFKIKSDQIDDNDQSDFVNTLEGDKFEVNPMMNLIYNRRHLRDKRVEEAKKLPKNGYLNLIFFY